MKILNLTLYREYFDQIFAGIKKIEYREISRYFISRLQNNDGTFKKYDQVHFKNGYATNAPFMSVEFNETIINDDLFEIHLGKVLETKNYTGPKTISKPIHKQKIIQYLPRNDAEEARFFSMK